MQQKGGRLPSELLVPAPGGGTGWVKLVLCFQGVHACQGLVPRLIPFIFKYLKEPFQLDESSPMVREEKHPSSCGQLPRWVAVARLSSPHLRVWPKGCRRQKEACRRLKKFRLQFLKYLMQFAIVIVFWDNAGGALGAVKHTEKCLGKRNPQTGNCGYFLLFPPCLTGWQLDVRKWPSICDSHLKVQTSLTFWLLEFNLTVYVDSIEDLCKNTHSPTLNILRPS